VMWIGSFPAATVDNIRIRNSTFRGVETAEVMNYVGRIELTNVTIEPAQKKASRNSRPAETPVENKPAAP